VTNTKVAATDVVVACIKTHTSAGSFIVAAVLSRRGRSPCA
jgi:hypothetical protein